MWTWASQIKSDIAVSPARGNKLEIFFVRHVQMGGAQYDSFEACWETECCQSSNSQESGMPDELNFFFRTCFCSRSEEHCGRIIHARELEAVQGINQE